MKKVIIIGATSGIGLELAKLYVQNGDRVGVTGRRQNLLDDIHQKFPLQVVTECFDVTGPENIPHVQTLINHLGGVDLLIYNAGYGEISEALDWKIDRQTTLTNVNGFVEIVNFIFNYFKERGEGQIAATSSVASIRENSMAPAYSASKAFLSMYMAGLHLKAVKLRKRNPRTEIYISDILPGYVRTKMSKGRGRFWEASVQKASRQIFNAIQKKRRKTYVTHRWVFIAWMLKWIPYFVVKRFG